MRKLFHNKNLLLVLVCPLLYLAVAVFTLGDYGINWDEPKHLIRGQAYLHYILTGKRDFCDFPVYLELKGAPDYVNYNVEPVVCTSRTEVGDSNIRRSYFQSDFYTLDYYFTKDDRVPLESKHSHPEINGLLSAVSNYIFYQKLGIVDDIESYHLFIVLSVFAIVLSVAYWTYINYGFMASLVASFSLAAYPLVFSESHFNVKDPVLMTFFGLAILSFWCGFSERKVLWIILSALFAGLALGTKFNTFFLPIILGPWALFILFERYKNNRKLDLLTLAGGRSILFSLILYPVIVFGILFALSPYLWTSPIEHFFEIVNYYKEIGRGTPSEQSSYIIAGWNAYPLVWIFYTTPLPILLLSGVGFVHAAILVIKKRSDVALLVLLWFLVPIARVVWPGMNIYGGVRQIMEFIPPMAVLSGMGSLFFVKKLGTKQTALVLLLVLTFVVWEMVKIHPNQNVYFNQLIGGLYRAEEKKIPSWGNTYGNVYLQGIDWMNKNAEENAKLALAVNYISVLPRVKLRSDISLDNAHWSGSRRGGEYVMEMNYDWPLGARYKYAYLDTFLAPVYEIKVGGIPLLKLWKNDREYEKVSAKEVVVKPVSISVESDPKKLKLDFDGVKLTKLVIDHSATNCEEQGGVGYLSVSRDRENWKREPGGLIDLESPYVTPEMGQNTFVFMFPARVASSLVLNSELVNPCILKDYKVTVWGLEK